MNATYWQVLCSRSDSTAFHGFSQGSLRHFMSVSVVQSITPYRLEFLSRLVISARQNIGCGKASGLSHMNHKHCQINFQNSKSDYQERKDAPSNVNDDIECIEATYCYQF
eukprot:2198177-Amphidinium_carterae.1